MSKRKPKILLWDLETSHNLVASFTLFKPVIPYGNIIKERSIICGSWKWLGQKKVESTSVIDFPTFKKDRQDDYYVVSKLREILEEADVIIAHNGDKFDWKYFNTRLLYHGLSPLPKPISIDTYKVVKKHFNFNSNRLDYVGKYLGLGEKIKTDNSMWLAIVDKNIDIKIATQKVKEMVKYNKQDVNLLEKVYLEIRPFMDNHPNYNVLIESKIEICPTCGGVHHQKRGFKYTRKGKYQQYQCQGCRGWFSSSTSLYTAKVK